MLIRLSVGEVNFEIGTEGREIPIEPCVGNFFVARRIPSGFPFFIDEH